MYFYQTNAVRGGNWNTPAPNEAVRGSAETKEGLVGELLGEGFEKAEIEKILAGFKAMLDTDLYIPGIVEWFASATDGESIVPIRDVRYKVSEYTIERPLLSVRYQNVGVTVWEIQLQEIKDAKKEFTQWAGRK